MINGLGVVGWGVGGIEAEAGMLGQPVSFKVPEVIGVRVFGKLQDGVSATDIALTVTQILRNEKVVGKFVEFFGEGARELSLADRATIANMAPEYGATMGYFPVDEKTLPGHTIDSAVYVDEKENVAFTGDTLFAMSVGRTDIEGSGGSDEVLLESLKKIAQLHENTTIYPGHGEASQIRLIFR